MDEVVDAVTDLSCFFPGGEEPLVFPIPEESSSGTNSSYDMSLSDRYKEASCLPFSSTQFD